jgi:uncharacterized protein YlxP (DUF503 family)
MSEAKIHIAVLYVDLFIGDSQSLKDKRMVIRSLKDRIRARYNVSVAELDGHDKWQVCQLGCSMIGTDSHYIDGALQSIISLIHSYHAVVICNQSIEFY